jgi:hypothetical protein
LQQTQTLKPVKLNTDAAIKKMPADSSPYILNQEISVNPNGGTNNGGSLGKGTPFAANRPACEIDQPAGENYTILTYESKRTSETYSGVYNSNGVNWIQRINADGTCQIIYDQPCLKFNAAPRNEIMPFRCGMRVEKICKNWAGKELIWVDGDMVSPGCLDVEASIATNSFTTPFFDICPDPCAYIQLCVPEICGCITAEFIPLLNSEVSLSNYIVDKAFKFMVKHIYYDGRASEWSDYSSLYYQQRDCIGGLAGAARCLKLRVPIGNPMVEKIVIAFSEDGGKIWYECETVEKYKSYNNSQQQWYERELAETISNSFLNIDCSFDYIFCNDKNRRTISEVEFSRERNPIPRKSQSLIQFADKFAFFNYEDGICPLPETETEKINISLECNESGCVSDMVEITFRAIIYCPIPHPTQLGGIPDTGYIFRMGGDSGNEKDNVLDTAYYNAVGNAAAITSGQQFYDRTRNFIVYIEGTEYWAEMKQWRADANFRNRRLVGVQPQGANSDKVLEILSFLGTGGFFYNECKIKVPKGTKGFARMVSNEASDGFGDRQNTSLGIYGILNDINTFKTHHGVSLEQYPIPDATLLKEIYFDTCVDFETTKAFLIKNCLGVDSIQAGYITDILGNPIEGLTFINESFPSSRIEHTLGNLVTDHNGYYNFESSQQISIDIFGETVCNQWGKVKTVDFFGQDEATTVTDIEIDDPGLNYSQNHFLQPYLIVTDCRGNRLPNINCVISGSKSVLTDNFGIAKYRIRNYKDKPRYIIAFVANNGSCITQDCNNNCNPCAVKLDFYTPTCYSPVSDIYLGLIRINNTILENKNGLKPGGFYKWAYRVKGNCGRVSSAYEFMEMNIPRLQETLGYKFCKFLYDTTRNSTTSMNFPEWGECLEILRTENLNGYELQWIVDDVERTIGGNLKLTFQSLNDYNTRFFDKTNTIYQYLAGDRVEFISNNGEILDAATYGILNYLVLSPFFDTSLSGKADPPADYFNQVLIKDDGRLDIIKPGAIIEFQRPKQATEELNPFFDICCVLPLKQVSNGDGTFHTELINPIGEFNTFDTYFIRRNIAGYVENFQHHSPSDFWGTKLTDAGRVFFVNQYENEKRYGRNVTINSPTQLNYFGDFIKTFDGILGGDIIGAFIQDDRDLMVVGEYDSFLARISNGLLQLDRNGNIQAAPINDIVSNPNDQPFGIYGCQYEDVGSLISGDGFVCWWDSQNMAYVKHDYQIAKDISIGKIKNYIQKRTIQKNFLNAATDINLDKIRFSTGQNVQSRSVFITLKRLRDSGINNEKELYFKINETLIFNPDANEFLGFCSFTPEAYSNLNITDDEGCAFITYLNGIPFIHPVLASKWNEFYGQACDSLITVCVNQFQDKEKVFLAIEIQSMQKWFAHSILTDNDIYLSEITPKKVKKYQRKWNAAFMGNINSRGGLFGTDLPSGYYCKILLIKDNTNADIYGSINPLEQTKYNEIDEVLCKFAIKEQSGFTSNL